MIQEIFPHQFNNQYLPHKKIEDNDFILHFNENTLLLNNCNDVFELPQKKDFPEILGETDYTFLFTLDDVPCFLMWDKLKINNPNFVYKEIDFFRYTQQQEIAWIIIAGFQLMNWYKLNKFCGKCGSKTLHKTDERALVCQECSNTVYPKISPAIIVAIICNDKILLARGSNFPGSWYSLVAGYVDIGESLEEALIREVKEEVGVDVKNIRYYKSQPWPLSGSMMIGFVAEADEKQQIVIDNKEIADAAWFSRDNLPQHSLNLSIAGEMIEKFQKSEL